MAEHQQDRADVVAEHQRTFDAFMRLWVYIFGVAAAILIFLAIFNT